MVQFLPPWRPSPSPSQSAGAIPNRCVTPPYTKVAKQRATPMHGTSLNMIYIMACIQMTNPGPHMRVGRPQLGLKGEAHFPPHALLHTATFRMI